MKMNGNIDQHLKIVNATTVTATGWLDFEPGGPQAVEVWVGLGQGDKKNSGAVFGEGSVVVNRPAGAGTQRVVWQCPAQLDNGAGAYKPGVADGGAVVIAGNVEPYPWGRQVNLA